MTTDDELRDYWLTTNDNDPHVHFQAPGDKPLPPAGIWPPPELAAARELLKQRAHRDASNDTE